MKLVNPRQRSARLLPSARGVSCGLDRHSRFGRGVSCGIDRHSRFGLWFRVSQRVGSSSAETVGFRVCLRRKR